MMQMLSYEQQLSGEMRRLKRNSRNVKTKDAKDFATHEIGHLEELNQGIGYQAALLKKEEDEAQAMVESSFDLARETGSQSNVDADEKMDDLQYRTQNLIHTG